MNRKLIITRIENKIWTALFEGELLTELHCSNDAENTSILGNIYVGKVKQVVNSIPAAFIEIAGGVECYYPLDDKKLRVGDELLVQVSKEAIKTKPPTVTSNLSFTGKYAVLTSGDCRVGVSAKLGSKERERLLHIATPYASEGYGFIIRTNAKDIDKTALCVELERLIAEYEAFVKIATTRTCFSCVKQAPKQYLTELRNIYQDGLTDIIVEDKAIYEEVRAFLASEQPEDLTKLQWYEDKLLPLHKLYSMETHIERALKERVWLKSGAYLVIQPTEALTVIDVNTGKYEGKKRNDSHKLKINLEAAVEAARQIRLRNLTGIIIVDFINLDSEDALKQLLHVFEKELHKDPVATSLVDVTGLQLVEVTRKKVRKPLHEAILD